MGISKIAIGAFRRNHALRRWSFDEPDHLCGASLKWLTRRKRSPAKGGNGMEMKAMQWPKVVCVLILGFALLLSGAVPKADAQLIKDKYYIIESVSSGQCLDLAAATLPTIDPIGEVVQKPCVRDAFGTGSQQWKLSRGGGKYTLKNRMTGAIMITDDRPGEYQYAVLTYYKDLLAPPLRPDSVEFTFEGSAPPAPPCKGRGCNDGGLLPIPTIPVCTEGDRCFIRNVGTREVLAVPGFDSRAGTGIQREKWTGGTNQLWRFRAAPGPDEYMIRLNGFEIAETMALHNDTLGVIFTVKVGDHEAEQRVAPIGDFNNGKHPKYFPLPFPDWTIGPYQIDGDTPVLITYTFLNNGHDATQKFTEELVDISQEVLDAVGTGIEIFFPATTPAVDQIKAGIATAATWIKWLEGKLNCDGQVLTDAITVWGYDLNITDWSPAGIDRLEGPYYGPGRSSVFNWLQGCNRHRAEYYVEWSIYPLR